MEPRYDLSLKDLIRAVSDELLASRQERTSSEQPAIWEVGELTIEASFVVTASGSGGGGFDLKILRADAKVDYGQETVHKITLTLKALDSEDTLTELGDELPLRPRRSD
jgi:hypothetical protein